jgi:triphosphoribosyl-dephospho-CoA synthase
MISSPRAGRPPSPSDMDIAAAYIDACHDELRALKPGNVHDFADGHRMAVWQFEESAVASAPPLALQGASVGERILGAIEATRAAVGVNTNLGIVLLCAPLAMAAEARKPLQRVLRGLTVDDARLAFRAIALAVPAGLGSAEEHDVHEAPRATLLEAMKAAGGRDRIARAYATDFEDVFRIGLPALAAAPRAPGWLPAASAYLAFLSAFPDSHIARKWGDAIAETVRMEAHALRQTLDWADPVPGLMAFDTALKARGLNPGTSADLAVATLFAKRLSNVLRSAPDNG